MRESLLFGSGFLNKDLWPLEFFGAEIIGVSLSEDWRTVAKRNELTIFRVHTGHQCATAAGANATLGECADDPVASS